MAFIIPLPCIPQRFLVAIIGLISLTINYMMRFCITIALPEMNKPTAGKRDTTCNYTMTASSVNKTYPFSWSSNDLSMIQASFFLGYAGSIIPAGLVSDMLGPKLPTIGCLLISGICSILSPFGATYIGAWGVIVPRFIIGLAQGLGYASLHTLVAIWIPKNERALWGSIVFSGVYAGNALNFGLSGLILSASEDGWKYVFFIYGSCGVICSIIFYLTVYNRPLDHPNLSEKEAKILQEYSENILKKQGEKLETPWKMIFTNNPVWSIIIAMIGHGWILFLIVTSMPTFLDRVLYFPIKSNGLFNALTNLGVWALSIISGFLCDFITAKNYISLTLNRKILFTISSIVPVIGLVLTGYTNCNRTLAIIWFVIGCAFLGFFYPSLKVNPIDVAPNYAGTIGALAHFASAISGVIVGYLTPAMVPNTSLQEWRYVFWLGFGIAIITNIYYVVFASAEVQTFNAGKKEELPKN